MVAVATFVALIALLFAVTTGGSAWFGMGLSLIPLLLLAGGGVFLIDRRD